MELLTILLILLVVTRACGEVALRFGQPVLVGELLGGIALGVVARQFEGTFPVLANLPDHEVFRAISDLGVFFLMLYAGMEMHPRDLVGTSGKALNVAIGGMVVPLAAGLALGWIALPQSEYLVPQVAFLGTALAITAVPVAVKVLMDLKRLDSRPGKMIVSAAIFDDIISLVLLAILTALIRTGEWPGATGLLLLGGKVLGFLVVTVLVGHFVMPWVADRLKWLKLEELEFSWLLMVGLGFAVFAEALHLHFILGAFAAGLFFTRRTFNQTAFKAVNQKVSAITNGFLAPLFFAGIGMHLDVSAFTAIPGFVFTLVAVAVLAKVIGAGVAAYWSGLKRKESLEVGIGMSARGAVELIIADIALRAGLFNRPDPPPPVIEHMFSAVVIMAIATTLLTPILLRWLGAGDKDGSG
ncbi:MAG TPA: cation:proton antiporter [Verrucomicrobiales bacterium]|nr:cation:proton antiporter [Verrucomicrobiales bacterium]